MKTAVVTGGGSGIGLAVATAARRRPTTSPPSTSSRPTTDFAFTADVTDRAAGRRRAVGDPRAARPGHRSGQRRGLDGFKRFTDITFEDWQRVIDVNLNGVFHMIQAVLPDMVEAGWGRIVNISSSSTHSGAPYMSHYVAAKSAVNGLTKSLALEYGPSGITVNAVPPGLHRHPDAAQRRGTRAISATSRRRIAATPVRRIGQAGRHRGGVRIPGFRGSRLHHRPDPRASTAAENAER